jgi:hypothetical protein
MGKVVVYTVKYWEKYYFWEKKISHYYARKENIQKLIYEKWLGENRGKKVKLLTISQEIKKN